MEINNNKAVKFLNIQVQQQMINKSRLNLKHNQMHSLIKMKILLLQTIHKLLYLKLMIAKKNNKLKKKKKMRTLIINPCLWLKKF